MSKAPRPPKTPPTPTPSDNPGTPEMEPHCWQLVPEEQSQIGQKLTVGDAVRGNQIGNRIQVNSNLGFVGYVPANEAGEIIRYLRGTKRRLVGQVLSNSDGVPLLELCAI